MSGCSSGWEGTTAHVQESDDFTGKSKSEIIELFGIPNRVISKKLNSGTEYWLYQSQQFHYVVLCGKTKVKVYIVKFVDTVVDSTHFADRGTVDEIATRGRKYLDLLTKTK